MKKIILILVFLIAGILKNAEAQSPVIDTLAHLQTIVANKSFFIGKPFSVLEYSLKMQIRYFSPERNIVSDTSKETNTGISFYFPNNENEMYLAYPMIRILWQAPLDASQSNVLWENNNGGGWSPTVAAYYATRIVTDIKILD